MKYTVKNFEKIINNYVNKVNTKNYTIVDITKNDLGCSLTQDCFCYHIYYKEKHIAKVWWRYHNNKIRIITWF